MVRSDDMQFVTSLLVPEYDDVEILAAASPEQSYLGDSDMQVPVSDAISHIVGFASDLLESEFFYFSASCLSDPIWFEKKFNNFVRYNYRKKSRRNTR